MKYFAKLTSQLSALEFREISDLFTAVFSKPVSTGQLQAKYRAPSRRDSCHGLMTDDNGRIAGALAVIPFDYSCFGRKAVFGCAVDLMVDKKYRNDITAMKKMHDAAVGLIGNGIDFLYAVPNRNSYLYFLKILGWSEIGPLNYYCLPLHASKLSPKLKGLDFISRPAAALLSGVSWPSTGHAFGHAFERPVVKTISPDFLTYRYPAGQYAAIEKSGQCARYSVVKEGALTTAYLIDVWPLTAAWLNETVRHIWHEERRCIDLILYVGTGVPRVHNLFKVPACFEPRALHLIGKVLNPENTDDRIYQIKNWQFNLSDLDVR
jgi:hypothetical protein